MLNYKIVIRLLVHREAALYALFIVLVGNAPRGYIQVHIYILCTELRAAAGVDGRRQ